MRCIARASEAGAPVFYVPLPIDEGKEYAALAAIYGQVGGPPLKIPRLDFTVQARRPATHVAGPLVVALETGHPTALYLALENERSCAKLGDLAVAVFRDLLEVPLTELEEVLGYEEEGSVRRAVRRGRRSWAKLSAWPWWCFGPEGRPAKDWRSGDWRSGSRAQSALDHWRDPRASNLERRARRREASSSPSTKAAPAPEGTQVPGAIF